MFNNPHHAKKTGGGVKGLIHELPTQNIQGGQAGEHYHLTFSEWQARNRDIVTVYNSTTMQDEIVFVDGNVIWFNL